MNIRVECEPSFRGDDEPRRFFLGQNSVEVLDIQDRWLSANHLYFMVLDSHGDMYILRRNFLFEGWEMTMYDSGNAAGNQYSAICRELDSPKSRPHC